MSYRAEEVVDGIVDLVLSVLKDGKTIEDHKSAKDSLVKLLDRFVDERAGTITDEKIADNRWRWEEGYDN